MQEENTQPINNNTTTHLQSIILNNPFLNYSSKPGMESVNTKDTISKSTDNFTNIAKPMMNMEIKSSTVTTELDTYAFYTIRNTLVNQQKK